MKTRTFKRAIGIFIIGLFLLLFTSKTTIVDGGGVWGQRPHTTFWPPTKLVDKGIGIMIDCMIDGKVSEDIACCV